MPIEHVIQQGDCLSSIARQYGFGDWRTIYGHALNQEFRKQRPDPNLLRPGDRLYIPDKTPKSVNCQTSGVHKFRLKELDTRLRIIVRGIDGRPVAGKKYELTVSGVCRRGILSDAGLLDQPIPPDAVEGRLRVWTDEETPEQPDIWNLKLGHLDPLETMTGIQARLNNLGYSCGPVDGISGPQTQSAIKAFQQDHGLTVDGIAGPQTRAKLQDRYGC